MRNDRIIILAVERVLKEYSDEDHILSMCEFRNRIRQEYGIYPDRRTVGSAIEELTEFGYDISTYSENGKGYYLRERKFEPSEIRLLMDRSVSVVESTSPTQLKLQNSFFTIGFVGNMYSPHFVTIC
jgi:hypothetical protein